MDADPGKKISYNPNFLGFGKYLFKRDELFFDKLNLYVRPWKKEVLLFPLAEVVSLKATGIEINQQIVWELTVRNNDKLKYFRFRDNRRGWNENFNRFLLRLRQINSAVVISKRAF